MTTLSQRLGNRWRPGVRLQAAACVVFALIVARWWALEFLPGRVLSLWGPYFLAPLGWLVAAAAAFYWYRRIDWRPGLEHAVEPGLIYLVAGLIGLFIVAAQVLLGIFADFGQSPFAHTPRWLATNALFAGSLLLAVEVSRAALLRALGGYSLTLSLLVVTMGLAAATLPDSLFTKPGLAAQLTFWGSVYIPTAATGLVAGFFVMYGGLRAGLLVATPLVLFQYFSPVLPVADWPMTALAGVAGPAVGLWVAEGLFEQDAAGEDEGSVVRLPSLAWTVTMVLSLVILWFSFGFFGYKPVFVPSGSMAPFIRQGDVVILGPVHPDSVKVGDVVLYQEVGGPRVLHRVVAVGRGEDGERVFTFKGDANNAPDSEPVQDKQLLGKFELRVPKAGWLPIKFQQALGRLL